MAEPRTRPFTYQDYLALDDDVRREVVDGELLAMPAPVMRHQHAVTALVIGLGAFVRAQRLGRVFTAPFDVILSDSDVFQPDVLFVAQDRVAKILRDAGVFGAPDLVVEVISPSTEERDRGKKLRAYGGAGVKEHWLVDASGAGRVEVRRLRRGRLVRVATLGPEDALETPLLPGLSLPVADLVPPA